jgi:hypothetical protein
MFSFKKNDINKLNILLGTKAKHKGNNYRFELNAQKTAHKLSLEIYPGIIIGKRRGNLISVYTGNANLQLHFCSGYIISPMLKEVTFIGESDGKLTGLIVEKEGGCSLYANVDREILSGDFTRLGPEVMLSGIALSLTESILPEKKKKRTGR